MIAFICHLLSRTCFFEQYSQALNREFLSWGLKLAYFTWLILTDSNDVISPVLHCSYDDDDDDVQWFNVHLKADWKPA